MPTTFERREVRRVLASSFLGTSVELYDFVLYSLAASLIFNKLFFAQLPDGVALIASFATLAVGYVVRPLGGVIFGHFGDRVGRKSMLVITMSMMGAASFCIGLLPTQAQIGTAAPILLVVLRLIQGIAVGGEWGGAALMALEHSGDERRGLSASFANMGGPAGAALATIVLLVCTSVWPEPFMTWGWRIPFFVSAVLVAVGLFIRLRVSESPVFLEAQRLAKADPTPKRAPIIELVTRYPLVVLLVILGTVMAFTLQGIMATFALPFAIAHGHTMTAVLWATTVANVLHIFAIPAYAALSDRIGRRTVMIAGTIATIILVQPILLLLGQGSFATMLFAFLLGMPVLQASMYGPLAAFVSEVFGARARYTGASLGYQIGATIGGGLGPLAATSIMAGKMGGSPLPVSLLVIAGGVVSVVALALTGRVKIAADEPARAIVAEPAFDGESSAVA